MYAQTLIKFFTQHCSASSTIVTPSTTEVTKTMALHWCTLIINLIGKTLDLFVLLIRRIFLYQKVTIRLLSKGCTLKKFVWVLVACFWKESFQWTDRCFLCVFFSICFCCSLYNTDVFTIVLADIHTRALPTCIHSLHVFAISSLFVLLGQERLFFKVTLFISTIIITTTITT